MFGLERFAKFEGNVRPHEGASLAAFEISDKAREPISGLKNFYLNKELNILIYSPLKGDYKE